MRFVAGLTVPMLTVMILLLLVTQDGFAEVWGSSRSKSYHLASCRYVKKTSKDYRIKFASAQEAKEAGYNPCEVCKPSKKTAPKHPTLKSTSASQDTVH